MWLRRDVTCECDLQAVAVMGTSLVVAMINDVMLAN